MLDISQDLPVIGRSRCLTVCAGAKSILDLRNTLEYLETMSVLVLGYQTDTLPAFYVRDSGIPLEHRVESAADIASIVEALDVTGAGDSFAAAFVSACAHGRSEDVALQQAVLFSSRKVQLTGTQPPGMAPAP